MTFAFSILQWYEFKNANDTSLLVVLTQARFFNRFCKPQVFLIFGGRYVFTSQSVIACLVFRYLGRAGLGRFPSPLSSRALLCPAQTHRSGANLSRHQTQEKTESRRQTHRQGKRLQARAHFTDRAEDCCQMYQDRNDFSRSERCFHPRS